MPLRGAATPGGPPPCSVTGWGLLWKSLEALEGPWKHPLFLISSPPPGLLSQKLQRMGCHFGRHLLPAHPLSGFASTSFDISEESQPLFI